MRTTKIVFVGAGSMSFGLSTLKDVFTCEVLKGSTIALVDIDEDNLNRMYEFSLVLNEKTGMDLRIEKYLDRRDALPGAEFVITSIAIERCNLWKKDFLVPKKYGIRHTLGENGGPGALFFSLRTIPVILDICNDMEELCPNAYLINFSNPESRIVLAVNKYTNIRCIGLCHGLFMAREDISRFTGIPEDDLELYAAGMNHFQFIFGIKNKRTGEDVYPLLREKEKALDPSVLPLTRRLFHAFGYWASCSDDHIGEYLAWGWEGGEEGYDFDKDEQQRVEMKDTIEGIISGRIRINDWLAPSGEKALEVISAIITGQRTYIPSAVVMNNGAISNLPDDVAVEIPIIVDAEGIHKVHIGPVPEGVRALLSGQIGPQVMSVEASVRGSRELALQALLCDPVVNSAEAAEKILNELWEINKIYIRPKIV